MTAIVLFPKRNKNAKNFSHKLMHLEEGFYMMWEAKPTKGRFEHEKK